MNYMTVTNSITSTNYTCARFLSSFIFIPKCGEQLVCIYVFFTNRNIKFNIQIINTPGIFFTDGENYEQEYKN